MDSSFYYSCQMAPEFERPRITEIHVRMDCNGCVQKIKKALDGINGIYDMYIDFQQQKVTIIGRADPERIIKAIKRVRKVAEICSHTEVLDSNSQPTEPNLDGGAPPPEGAGSGQQPSYSQPAEPPRPEDAPFAAPQEPPGEQQQPEWTASPVPVDMQPNQPSPTSNPYNNPQDYSRRHGYGNGYTPGYSQSYDGQWKNHPRHNYRYEPQQQHDYHEPPQYSSYYEGARPVYPESGYHERNRPVYDSPQPRPVYYDPPSQPQYHDMPSRTEYHEPSPQGHYHETPTSQAVYQEQQPRPVYATHSYNMYRPAPSIKEYHRVQSPPTYTPHNRTDYYQMDSYQYGNSSNGDDTSIFSDENPNACTIV